jgi:hypothetical protein
MVIIAYVVSYAIPLTTILPLAVITPWLTLPLTPELVAGVLLYPAPPPQPPNSKLKSAARIAMILLKG